MANSSLTCEFLIALKAGFLLHDGYHIWLDRSTPKGVAHNVIFLALITFASKGGYFTLKTRAKAQNLICPPLFTHSLISTERPSTPHHLNHRNLSEDRGSRRAFSKSGKIVQKGISPSQQTLAGIDTA